MTPGRRPRLTEADHAAWAGVTRHAVPLAGRSPLAGNAGTNGAPQSKRPDAPPNNAGLPGAPQHGAPQSSASQSGASQSGASQSGAPPPGAPPRCETRPPSPHPPPRWAGTRARLNAATIPLAIGGPPAGVDKATWQRFRTGKLAAVRKLDLHGMTAQRAFQALTGFLRTAHAEHVRCVEIVTGRGRGDGAGEARGEATGVLRREFPLWLNRPDIRPLVLGAAHPHAANTGAVRLLLRRAR